MSVKLIIVLFKISLVSLSYLSNNCCILGLFWIKVRVGYDWWAVLNDSNLLVFNIE